MSDPRPISFESALREFEEARRAGVFTPTPGAARALLAMAPASTGGRVLRRWASVAAVLALVVGAWNLGVFSGSDTARVALASPCDGSFFGCVTGPKTVPGSPCNDFDYDADGDVDMADFRTYQLACEGLNH